MDRKPLTDEQQQLVVAYLPLARSLAKPFKRQWPNYSDEFESEAMWALIRAAERFDPTRGVRFAIYARPTIIGALKDKHGALASPHQKNMESTVEHVSVRIEVEGRCADRELIAKVSRFLPRLERKIVRFVDQLGLSQVQAKRKMSRTRWPVRISATSVSVYRKQAHDLMRRLAPVLSDPAFMRRATRRLTPRQFEAFQNVYLRGMGPVAAGRRMGIRHQNVGKLCRKAMVKVERELQAMAEEG